MRKEKVTLLDVIEHYSKRNKKIDEHLRRLDDIERNLHYLELESP
jgi:hypothetical protein